MTKRGRKSEAELLSLSVVRPRVRADREPPAHDRPEPPHHLSPATKAWWQQVLQNYEIQDHALRTLQAIAESWDRREEARKALARHGLTYTDDHGMVRPRPEVQIERVRHDSNKIQFPRILQPHFSGSGLIGDVELFQISRGETCAPRGCYYALFSHDIGENPVLTDCKFERAFFAHNHHPDGSKFFAFEFSCGSTFTYVQVSKDHFCSAHVRF